MTNQVQVTQERGQLRLLTYNIHKGLSSGNRLHIAPPLKEALHSTDSDIVLLQEVVGENIQFQSRFKDWPSMAQYDFFKSDTLSYCTYGRNAKYSSGDHGNAILSRYPFSFECNVDISIYRFSNRGFLHTQVSIHGTKDILHVFCTHFGLIEQERRAQAERLCRYIENEVPSHAPLVIGGDFNDWRKRLSPLFKNKLQLSEAFGEFYGSHARSFPAWLPISCLDRIYYRNLALKSCQRLIGKPWSLLSDHIPLVADFNYP